MKEQQVDFSVVNDTMIQAAHSTTTQYGGPNQQDLCFHLVNSRTRSACRLRVDASITDSWWQPPLEANTSTGTAAERHQLQHKVYSFYMTARASTALLAALHTAAASPVQQPVATTWQSADDFFVFKVWVPTA